MNKLDVEGFIKNLWQILTESILGVLATTYIYWTLLKGKILMDSVLTYIASNPSIFPHQKIVQYGSADVMLYIYVPAMQG